VTDDDSPVPVFTGAELALADALILIMKVMAMHGVIDGRAIDTVFSDLEHRYREQKFTTAAAMADYLRTLAIDEDRDVRLMRLGTPRDRSPEG
jgi:hypothetical protein